MGRMSSTHTPTIERSRNQSIGGGWKLDRVRVSEINLVGSSETMIWAWIFLHSGPVLWQDQIRKRTNIQTSHMRRENIYKL